MFSMASASAQNSVSKTRWSLRQALLGLAAARVAAGSMDPAQRPQPSFLVFLLLIAAWCLGEAIPSDEG